MTAAHELLSEFFDCLRNLESSIDRCVDLFAETGVFEFPYFSALGLQTRFEGKAAVRDVLLQIRSLVPRFQISDIRVYEIDRGRGLFTEYHSDGCVAGTQHVCGIL